MRSNQRLLRLAFWWILTAPWILSANSFEGSFVANFAIYNGLNRNFPVQNKMSLAAGRFACEEENCDNLKDR